MNVVRSASISNTNKRAIGLVAYEEVDCESAEQAGSQRSKFDMDSVFT